jgi:cephalosporin hydroxylase
MTTSTRLIIPLLRFTSNLPVLFSKKKKPSAADPEFSLTGIDRGHHQVSYRGIKCVKCPFDYVMYQMLLFEIQPDLLIEVGSYMGGSAMYYADLMDIIGKGEIHSVNIKNELDDRSIHPRVKFSFDGWENYRLPETGKYETVMVIEDSTHTYQNTMSVMKRFAPVVTVGSYLVVEDGIIDALGLARDYGGGPGRAIKEFLTNNSNFEIDHRWTDMFGKNATFNVDGYLKRIPGDRLHVNSQKIF